MVNKKKGTVLAEVLVALFVFGFVCMMMVQLIGSLINLVKSSQSSNFELAIKQVSWQISSSNHLYRNENDYCFAYQDNHRCLKIINNRLVLTPGIQIVLNNYDNLKLFEKENQLWISAAKKGTVYEAIVYNIQP